jgi:hypothetical protein
MAQPEASRVQLYTGNGNDFQPRLAIAALP